MSSEQSSGNTMNHGLYWPVTPGSPTIPSPSVSENSGYTTSYDSLSSPHNSYIEYASRGQSQTLSPIQPGHRHSATSSSLQYALRAQTRHPSISLSSVQNVLPTSTDPISNLSLVSPLGQSQGTERAGAEPNALTNGTVYSRQHTQVQTYQPQSQDHVHSHAYTTDALNDALSVTNTNNFGNGNENFRTNSNSRLYTFDSPGPIRHEHDSNSAPFSGTSAGVSSAPHSPDSGSGMGSPPPGLFRSHLSRSIHGIQAAYSGTVSTHVRTNHDIDSPLVRVSNHLQTSISGNGIQPRVKMEPDLENHSYSNHAMVVEGGGDGTKDDIGARFVMEHPYPYTYATPKSSVRQGGNFGTSPPTSEELMDLGNAPHSGTFPHSPSTAPSLQQPQSQPHSLTAPLRAVNANAAMRACMGVFRLDPFAQLNGVALRCGFINDPTSFGEPSGRNKAKSKSKARKRGKGKRKRSGSDVVFSSGEQDEESEDDFDDEDAPTWDGGQACPLKEEPVMLEFQVYFEGMEIEGSDSEHTTTDSVRLPGYEGEHDSDEDQDSVGDDNNIGGKDSQSIKGPRRLHLVEDAHGNRYPNNSSEGDPTRDQGYSYGRNTNPHNNDIVDRSKHTISPNFEDYLDFDVDMERTRDWTSGDLELSPSSPYPLLDGGSNTLALMSSRIRAQTPGSSSTSGRTPTFTDDPNLLKPVPFASCSIFTSGRGQSTVGSQHVDPSDYMRLSDAVPHSSNATDVDRMNNVQSRQVQSPYTNSSSTTAGLSLPAGTSATLQQLRTQAAVRAVQQHHQNQSQSRSHSAQTQALFRSSLGDSACLQRSNGANLARFTPTPASVAAEMHTGLLSSGRTGQQVLQQQSRARAASVASLQSPQGQTLGQNLTGPGFVGTNTSSSYVQQVSSGSHNGSTYSHYPYPDYDPGAGIGSKSATLAGSLDDNVSVQSSRSGLTSRSGMTTAGNGVGVVGLVPTQTNGHGYGEANLHAVQRRWSDALQRVQA